MAKSKCTTKEKEVLVKFMRMMEALTDKLDFEREAKERAQRLLQMNGISYH